VIRLSNPEMDKGRVDPRVGSGRVGSGRVGSKCLKCIVNFAVRGVLIEIVMKKHRE